MTHTKRISKSSRALCILGSLFLLVMGAFHGSGYNYVSEAISISNSDEFLKEIVPVLFIHPSVHLISLAALGLLVVFLDRDWRKLAWTLATLILIDAILAFYLGAFIPGSILMTSSICFFIAGLKHFIEKNPHVN